MMLDFLSEISEDLRLLSLERRSVEVVGVAEPAICSEKLLVRGSHLLSRVAEVMTINRMEITYFRCFIHRRQGVVAVPFKHKRGLLTCGNILVVDPNEWLALNSFVQRDIELCGKVETSTRLSVVQRRRR
jgi:hypothetical protein